jgi:hypothetical protein
LSMHAWPKFTRASKVSNAVGMMEFMVEMSISLRKLCGSLSVFCELLISLSIVTS